VVYLVYRVYTPVAPVATPTSSQGIMSAVPQGSLVENGSGDNSSQIGTAPTSSSGTSIGNAISNAISSIGSMTQEELLEQPLDMVLQDLLEVT
jgi:hypothetical protein